MLRITLASRLLVSRFLGAARDLLSVTTEAPSTRPVWAAVVSCAPVARRGLPSESSAVLPKQRTLHRRRRTSCAPGSPAGDINAWPTTSFEWRRLAISTAARPHRRRSRPRSHRSPSPPISCSWRETLTDHGRPDEAHMVARALSTVRIPVVAVLGNHDFESDQQDQVRDIIAGAGVTHPRRRCVRGTWHRHRRGERIRGRIRSARPGPLGRTNHQTIRP